MLDTGHQVQEIEGKLARLISLAIPMNREKEPEEY